MAVIAKMLTCDTALMKRLGCVPYASISPEDVENSPFIFVRASVLRKMSPAERFDPASPDLWWPLVEGADKPLPRSLR